MARTKAEIRAFLDSQVGKKVNAKAGIYNGQCVSLIKALLEFLGAPDPYAARGNAKDVGDTLIRQGIAANKDGWLRVVINRSMGNIGGVTYGHIWIDLKDEANYEQNGARALYTTKNTRPFSQRQQVVNLDKYIKADPPKETVVKPNKTEIDNAFNLLGVPDNVAHKDKDYKYYQSKDRGVLWSNVAKALYDKSQALKKQLAAATAAKVDKAAVIDYINKNTK